MLRQFIRSAIRDCAVCRIGDLCASSSPATTTLITPEALISSAVTYAANGVRKLRPLSITGSVTCLRTKPITKKNDQPDEDPAAGSDDEVAADDRARPRSPWPPRWRCSARPARSRR